MLKIFVVYLSRHIGRDGQQPSVYCISRQLAEEFKAGQVNPDSWRIKEVEVYTH